MAVAADRSRINSLDFGLMSLGSMLAVYSAGMSIGQPEIGFFFVRLVLLGTLFSFFVRRLLGNTWFIKLDGVIYAGLALGVITQSGQLNALLPGEPFPRELIAAGWLGWMLAVGSFVTWRDGTLLFQAVPAMALFGLVGCYDTFRDVTFAFFGFLICLATLFSRANGREMLRMAAESGFVTRAEALNRSRVEVRRDQALFDRMRNGPWRWVAGPEWALLSALIVVLLSLLGAPVIQRSVETVASQVRVQVPTVRLNAQNPPGRDVNPSSVQVGRGPNTSLTQRPVYEIAIRDWDLYFRTGTYDRWSPAGWVRAQEAPDFRWMWQDRERRSFTIRPLDPIRTLASPVETEAYQSRRVRIGGDGTFELSDYTPGRDYSGWAERLPNADAIAQTSFRDVEGLPSQYVDIASIHPEVIALARQVTEGAATDRERADRIRDAIAARVRYNLRAAATPPGVDPVYHFLFVSQEGYCDLYASAMVHMARAVGIPARYVQGFLADAENTDRAGRTVILERDYHAWAEILFADAGWIIFDATSGTREVEGGERGSSLTDLPFWQRAEFRRALDVLMIVLIAVGGGILIWTMRRRQGTVTRKSELDRSFVRFIRALERVSGRRKIAGESPREFVEAASISLNGETELARTLERQFERAFYAPDGIDEEAAAKLIGGVRELETALKRRGRR